MRKIKWTLVILCFTGTLFAGNPQIVFKGQWGKGPAQFGLRQAPDARYGPQAFRVVNDSIYILDEQNRSLKRIGHGSVKNILTVGSLSRDFFVQSTKRFTLISDEGISEYRNNKLFRQIPLERGRILQSTLVLPSGEMKLHFSNGTQEPVSPAKSFQKSGNEIHARRVNASRGAILGGQNGQPLFTIDIPQKNLASIRYLGSDNRNRLFIELELFVRQVPLLVTREVRVFTSKGNPVALYRIPLNNYALIFRDLEVTPDGALYQLLEDANGIRVLKWELPETESAGKVKIINLPALDYDNPPETQLSEPDHGALYKPGSLPDVTPETALAIGDTYDKLFWDCSSSNLTYGRITDNYGNHVETPGWLSVGQMQRVPYKWGGFNTIDGFLDGISQGKYAGDKATDSVSPEAVGVDCSGFVSRCWTLPSHYSTSMMPDITNPYDNWELAQPGDACHRVGHVRLIVAHEDDGTLDMIEAAGFNWRVSYTNYRYSQITGYTPRYYIHMQGTPGNIPQPTITSLKKETRVCLNWKAASRSSIYKFQLYTSEDGATWQTFGQLPADTSRYDAPLENNAAVYYKIVSIAASDGSTEGLPSDGYGAYRKDGKQKVLIVDGFDRTSYSVGSWPHAYHNFAAVHGRALEILHIPFETVPNESVLDHTVQLSDYAAVVWVLGDESTFDETFSDAEQTLVKAYLQQGGKLFVSGSEIGWDLDHKGKASDQTFYHDFLKARYEEDDAASYTVKGEPGTAFSGLTLHFDDGSHDVYEEDYPDAISPLNGAETILRYANGKIAAVSYKGMFNGGSREGALVYVAFPFETVYTESERIDMMQAVMTVFDMQPTVGMDDNSFPSITGFFLLQNYPNPFNNQTHICYLTPAAGSAEITVFNSLGQSVFRQKRPPVLPGIHSFILDGKSWASGTYFYRLQFTGEEKSYSAQGRFTLLK